MMIINCQVCGKDITEFALSYRAPHDGPGPLLCPRCLGNAHYTVRDLAQAQRAREYHRRLAAHQGAKR